MFDVPEAENSQLCMDPGDSMFGNENEGDDPLVRTSSTAQFVDSVDTHRPCQTRPTALQVFTKAKDAGEVPDMRQAAVL